MTESTPAAPTHLQINFYRMNYGKFEYLLLKRAGDNQHNDKDFWQAVTAPIMPGSDIGAAVKRATLEQVGVTHIKRLSEEMYSYEWYTPAGERGRDIVFAAELDRQTPIQIDDTKYSAYQWLDYDKAWLQVKWRGAKDALKDLHKFLESKKLSNPEYWPKHETGLYGYTGQASAGQSLSPAQTQVQNQAQDPQSPAATTSPYGNNVPKRLPDRPEESHERGDLEEEKEVNTGEWFL